MDLFSGIGGFALAARWAGIRTVQFVENETYCQKVLRKNFPGIPIHDDIEDFDAAKFRRPFLLTGGYPCQPFSQAGKQQGTRDDRHLWPEMLRVVRECRPDWVLGENVAGHISMGLDDVLSDLEGEGYSTRAFVIPACAVDASHRRERVWIVGNYHVEPFHHCLDGRIEEGGSTVASTGEVDFRYSGCRALADSDGSRRTPSWNDWRMGWVRKPIEDSGNHDFERWITEPDVGRVAHGIPSRVDRLKGLGNAVVPQVAYEIIKAMVKV